ncbi:unannotated protein [freshwater metagenome]|uniref:Unannotated protein n=1 Tax=freshwater metagenome TaxID=449393 RepID=A0A6J7E8A3_9ZZZZ
MCRLIGTRPTLDVDVDVQVRARVAIGDVRVLDLDPQLLLRDSQGRVDVLDLVSGRGNPVSAMNHVVAWRQCRIGGQRGEVVGVVGVKHAARRRRGEIVTRVEAIGRVGERARRGSVGGRRIVGGDRDPLDDLERLVGSVVERRGPVVVTAIHSVEHVEANSIGRLPVGQNGFAVDIELDEITDCGAGAWVARARCGGGIEAVEPLHHAGWCGRRIQAPAMHGAGLQRRRDGGGVADGVTHHDLGLARQRRRCGRVRRQGSELHSARIALRADRSQHTTLVGAVDVVALACCVVAMVHCRAPALQPDGLGRSAVVSQGLQTHAVHGDLGTGAPPIAGEVATEIGGVDRPIRTTIAGRGPVA